MEDRSRLQPNTAIKKLTKLDNTNSVQQMTQWIAGNVLETNTLGKKAVAELLRTVPGPLSDALSRRQ